MHLQVQGYHPAHPRVVGVLILGERGFQLQHVLGVEKLAAPARPQRIEYIAVTTRLAILELAGCPREVRAAPAVSPAIVKHFRDGHLRVLEQSERVSTDPQPGLVRRVPGILLRLGDVRDLLPELLDDVRDGVGAS